MWEWFSKCCISRKNLKILKAGGEDQIERRRAIAKLFDDVDLDVDSFLSQSEVKLFGEALASNSNWSNNKTEDFFKELDVDGDGDVERAEFIEFYLEKLPDDEHMDDFREKIAQLQAASAEMANKQPKNTEEVVERRRALAAVFDDLDVDMSGFLTEGELSAVMSFEKAGEGHKNAQKENMKLFIDLDKGQDGLVDRVEFVTHYNKTLSTDMDEFYRQVEAIQEGVRGVLAQGYRPL